MKADAVINLVSAALEGRRDEVIRLARLMEAQEDAAGRKAVSKSLRRTLDYHTTSRGTMIKLPAADNAGMTAIMPSKGINDVVLSPSVRQTIVQLEREYQSREQLMDNGLRPRNRLLFHGPPGNGKTTVAEVVASILQRPLLIVRHSDVFDSHLGCTGAKLVKVFSAAQGQECVLFFDEFDAFAVARSGGDSSAGKETNRIVSQLLMCLDEMPSSVIFVGATNMLDIMDSAVKRRFDLVCEFGPPGSEQIQAFVALMQARHKVLASVPAQRLADMASAAVSFAEAETAIQNYARELVLAL